MIRYLFLLSLCVLAVATRLLPHPANFTPITALALFGGVYFERKYAFILPLVVLFASDLFLGLYSGMEWVYGSFALIGLLGLWLRSRKSVPVIAGTTLAGSILFFIITNFGVWLGGTLYTPDFTGLIACYTAALPFFRNTLLGDGFYVAILFGVTELVTRSVPALAQPAEERIR